MSSQNVIILNLLLVNGEKNRVQVLILLTFTCEDRSYEAIYLDAFCYCHFLS